MADLDSRRWFADWLKRQECDRVEQITLTPVGYADLITEAWEYALESRQLEIDAPKAELKDRQDATIKLKGGLLVEEAINLHRELRRIKGDVKHQTDIAERRKVSIGVLKARVAELEARVLPDELHGIRRGLEMAIGQLLFMATEDTISDAIDEIRVLIPGPGAEADCPAPDERKEN